MNFPTVNINELPDLKMTSQTSSRPTTFANAGSQELLIIVVTYFLETRAAPSMMR